MFRVSIILPFRSSLTRNLQLSIEISFFMSPNLSFSLAGSGSALCDESAAQPAVLVTINLTSVLELSENLFKPLSLSL